MGSQPKVQPCWRVLGAGSAKETGLSGTIAFWSEPQMQCLPNKPLLGCGNQAEGPHVDTDMHEGPPRAPATTDPVT